MKGTKELNDYKKLLLSTSYTRGTEAERSFIMQRNQFLRGFLPNALYKYRECNENSFSAFFEDRIYFNTPSNFNDPFDCSVYIDKKKIVNEIKSLYNIDYPKILLDIRKSSYLIESAFSANELPLVKQIYDYVKGLSDKDFELLHIDKLLLKNQIDNYISQMELFADAIIKDNTFNNFISCFSENIDSILMWSHYANNHKGFALQYEFVSDEMGQFNEPDFLFQIHPVIYDNTRIDATAYVAEWLKFAIARFYSKEDYKFSMPDELFYTKAFTLKSIVWKYEKEWRIICSSRQNLNSPISITVKPKSIFLGAKISNINRQILINIATQKKIPIYEMLLKDKSQSFLLEKKCLKEPK